MVADDNNPYCMICGRHLGMPFHETSEHAEARRQADPADRAALDRLDEYYRGEHG